MKTGMRFDRFGAASAAAALLLATGCGTSKSPEPVKAEKSGEMDRYWALTRMSSAPYSGDSKKIDAYIAAMESFLNDFPGSKVAHEVRFNLIYVTRLAAPEKALKELDYSIKENPDSPRADSFRWLKAEVLLRLERADEAIPMLEEMIAKDLYRDHSYKLLADHWEKVGETGKAQAAREKAQEMTPGKQAYEHLKAKEFDKLLELTSGLIRDNASPSRRDEYRYLQSQALLGLGRNDEGVAALEALAADGKGLTMNNLPYSYVACRRLADHWVEQGSVENARRSLEKAKEVANASPALIRIVDRELAKLDRKQEKPEAPGSEQ